MSDNKGKRKLELAPTSSQFAAGGEGEPAQLPHGELVALVKATQKHIGPHLWTDFLEGALAGVKLRDPAKHGKQVLLSFVQSMLGAGSGGLAAAATDGNTDSVDEDDEPQRATGPMSNRQFVLRYLKWLHTRKLDAAVVPRGPDDKQAGSSKAEVAAMQQAGNSPWSLVKRTQRHARFGALYSFPSYSAGWYQTPRVPAATATASGGDAQHDTAQQQQQPAAGASVVAPRLLAIDCEMVATEESPSALAGLCVVDMQGRAVYKVLVRPEGIVTDYRTHLTGLTAADFEGPNAVSFEQAHQAVRLLLGAGDGKPPVPGSGAREAQPTNQPGGTRAGALSPAVQDADDAKTTRPAKRRRAEKRREAAAAAAAAASAAGGVEDPAPHPAVDSNHTDQQQQQQQRLQQAGGRVILVGHALHHDLTALRIDHQPVIDTSLLFSFKSLPECTPSLKDLAKAVLGRGMRATAPTPEVAGGAAAAAGKGVSHGANGAASPSSARHDCQEDASVAMALVVHELGQPGPTGPLQPPEVHVPKEDLRKLLVHQLPKGTSEEQLLALFRRTAGCPVPVSAEFQDDGRRALVVFEHAGHANEAFKKLEGTRGQDSQGRQSKEVVLVAPAASAAAGEAAASGKGSGARVKVRKMACHNGLAFQPVKGPINCGKRPTASAPGVSADNAAKGAVGRGGAAADASVVRAAAKAKRTPKAA